MGNEPDEEQQMMHMLMYSNEFDLEGLIAVTGKFLNPNSKNPAKQKLYPELFHHLIEGYSQVYENLKKHADGWPEPEYLTSIVRNGQKGYGTLGVGEEKTSEGSKLIVEALKKKDQRPVYIVINAGSNTLAQALYDLKKEATEEEMAKYIAKIRVYENGAQDNAGAYICHNYPDIFWIRSNYQTYCYGGASVDGGYDNKGDRNELGPHVWKPYAYSGVGQHQWLLEHIIGNHGPFGKYYPLRQFHRGGISFMEGGGTIPWLGLINKGLFSIDHPHWGSWSGRYTREKIENEMSKHASVNKDEKHYMPFAMYIDDADEWTDPESGKEYNNPFSPVFRWRRAFLEDFKGRMDWCRNSYENANHNPVATIDGDNSNTILFKEIKAGKKISFDASSSTDPDGDGLKYNWWIYKEAGTYEDAVIIENNTSERARITIPKEAKGKEIHLILEIIDDNKIVNLRDYRRIVISVI